MRRLARAVRASGSRFGARPGVARGVDEGLGRRFVLGRCEFAQKQLLHDDELRVVGADGLGELCRQRFHVGQCSARSLPVDVDDASVEGFAELQLAEDRPAARIELRDSPLIVAEQEPAARRRRPR